MFQLPSRWDFPGMTVVAVPGNPPASLRGCRLLGRNAGSGIWLLFFRVQAQGQEHAAGPGDPRHRREPAERRRCRLRLSNGSRGFWQGDSRLPAHCWFSGWPGSRGTDRPVDRVPGSQELKHRVLAAPFSAWASRSGCFSSKAYYAQMPGTFSCSPSAFLVPCLHLKIRVFLVVMP